jgi:hypothetical protein
MPGCFPTLIHACGHKAESIYRRDAIVARHDLVVGIKRLADYRATVDKTAAEKKVVEIKEAVRLEFLY